MKKALRYFGFGFTFVALLGVGVAVGGVYVLYRFGRDLPDYRQLANYEPPVATRVHAADGRLIAEFARQQRLFVPITQVPKNLINAFLSAEDKKFYSHGGLDYIGNVRAVLFNLRNIANDRRPTGASTITQQVARNFFLSNDVNYIRKLKEAILSFRIEHAFTKDEILELYLNEIYLGFGSYGVAAASLNYFNKSLDELTLAEMAYLAALPKGPSNYHPIRNVRAATARRNWVLGRMAEDDHITPEQLKEALSSPLIVHGRGGTEFTRAEYFTEEVRRQLYDRFGERGLYDSGLSVRTTLDTTLQAIAERALRQGLVEYDRRHGWRGAIRNIDASEGWQDRLAALDVPLGMPAWRLAVAREVTEDGVSLGFADGQLGFMPLAEMTWARRWLEGEYLGARVDKPGDVLAPGDVVVVERLRVESAGGEGSLRIVEGGSSGPALYALRQIPAIEGGLVALDPHTGRVLALVGGFDYRRSQFNRAVQAMRQPGSAFKPFVYAAALDSGFTPSSLVMDAPFVIDQGYGLGKWKPENHGNRFYGPSTIRLGIEKSRNLMTVRLAQYIGMDIIVDYARRFEINDSMPPILSMALGAGETSLLKLTTAYAMMDNGGLRVTPALIDRVQDRRGNTIFRHDTRECLGCLATWEPELTEPSIPDGRERVIDRATAYQVVSMLQGVVERGTGARVRAVGKPLAGKTGTTNDSNDAWFVGFSPDLVVGVFTGFDEPRSLGRGEEGSSVAVPIFRDFMIAALKGQPATPFRIPPGIKLVRVNPATGLLAKPGDRDVILEAFKPGTEPAGEQFVLDGSGGVVQTGADRPVGTGGLY